ncbi:cryptochrome/photolyase family protein [Pseudobdellovibrio sp. HCB154]|uniref:cryptochrome/photolyase family protein n=1 Tax=Pseudobdellovibrio sp. HCB154 TaxID=3386277 RepID=UPI00391726D5
MNKTYTLFWFRRDLRLFDNAGLFNALKHEENVLPVFIFDTEILKKLPAIDLRVQFIHETVAELKKQLQKRKSDLVVEHGSPIEVYKKLLEKYPIKAIYTNHDYEPYARTRDEKIAKLCAAKKVEFKTFKDQAIFEKSEIVTDQENPYTVFTPYKNKWLKALSPFYLKSYPVELYESNFTKIKPSAMPSLKSLGFEAQDFTFPEPTVSASLLKNYAKTRDFPELDHGTSHLGLHLRFGTVSIRELAREAKKFSDVWLSELAWRDFFMQILWHYPHVEKQSFKPQYDKIAWRESKSELELWKTGQTGYPLVDAGMRELNATGYMHNRVRMVTASFLAKHLLHYWYEGERYFAEKLLDYDLAANNGNWQWAASTGCDAAPYFRIFNPESQIERFDPDYEYVKKWVPEYNTAKYVKPMVEHKFARERALAAFKKGLKK